MADLYTSYETSLALRDAGAPQDGRYVRRASGNVIEAWGSRLAEQAPEHFVAAFRADEIIEALTGRIDMLTPFKSGRWACRIKPASVPPGQVWVDDYFGDSMVEALAAAWLAMLKEVSRFEPG